VTLSSVASSSSPTPFSVRVKITELGTDGLAFDGFECPLTATANSSTVFTLDTTTCAWTDPTSGCSYTFNYASGGGARVGNTIAYDGSGTASWVCPAGSSGTFSESADLAI
jgi:hypothetical protein